MIPIQAVNVFVSPVFTRKVKWNFIIIVSFVTHGIQMLECVKIMFIKKEEYKRLRSLIDFQHDKIMQLQEENAELKKQLHYQKTYNTVFNQKIREVIFPNTDERGLGEPGTPIDFPDMF